ncbi:MAG: bifunctional adenosylcobinamide kinase/adenosylcobinamide-phosphate guanylyltransferase [Firmicutes bacterium]|nr:bifunctional adenosylcobinamide kinase/adenosylcobinamide-phosphate guanylyltransferase [Bacillota bacterium]
MNVLISGGAKNGKSYYAQRIAKEMAEEQKVPLYYIATMIPHDEEDRARVARHVSERAGWGFQTLEQGRDLPELLCREGGETEGAQAAGSETAQVDPRGVFLLDSVTALLSNEMFDANGYFDPGAGERVAADCTAFARATGNTVFVSDYIYGDAEEYDTMTEDYRRALAAVDRQLAEACDRVIEVSAGQIEEWK